MIYRKINDVMRMIQKDYPKWYDEVFYQLNGHQVPIAEKSNELKIELIKRKIHPDYLLVTYYFYNPSGITQGIEKSQWSKFKIILGYDKNYKPY